MVLGNPTEPFRRNNKISNMQAQWLSDNRRCWGCYRLSNECPSAKEGPKSCAMYGKTVPLNGTVVPGAPGWK